MGSARSEATLGKTLKYASTRSAKVKYSHRPTKSSINSSFKTEIDKQSATKPQNSGVSFKSSNVGNILIVEKSDTKKKAGIKRTPKTGMPPGVSKLKMPFKMPVGGGEAGTNIKKIQIDLESSRQMRSKQESIIHRMAGSPK